MHRRDFVAGLLSSAALPLGAVALRAAAQPAGNAVNVVEQFGFVPDGRTDNYDAFHRWAAHVNRVGGGHYVFPPGTYFVRKYRTKIHETRDPREIINPIVDGARGLTITGYGARIRLNGAFHRSARKGPDGRAVGLFTGTVMPFTIHRSSNVTIKGFDMDGGVREMSRDTDIAECFAGLIVLHGCTNVLLEDLDLHHSQTDAIYLVSSFEGGGLGVVPSIACRDVVLRNVKCHDNARGGLAIIQARGVLCEDCAFSRNGGTGKYLPHPPQFGVDIEPDYVPPYVDVMTGNVELRRCEFLDNAVSAVLCGAPQTCSGYQRIMDCRSTNRLGGTYHFMLIGVDTMLEGGVHDIGTGGINLSWHGQVGGNVTLRKCEIRTSGLYGIAHYWDGNLARMEDVRIIGAQTEPGTHGEMILFRSDPGGGRRSVMRGCDVFIPAARKSREHPYDYEVILYRTISEGNVFRTDLPATGGQHFAIGYDEGGAHGDRFRGTAPGTADSIRPVHNSTHDTRMPFSSS